MRTLFHRVLSLVVPVVSLVSPLGAQDGPPKGPPPTPVRIATVTEQSLAPRKKVFGQLRAVQRSTVAAEEAGIVRRMLVTEGARVESGALLAELDATRLRLELAANKAGLEAAMATVVERDAAVRREQRNLELLQRAAAEGGTNPREIADAEGDLAMAQAQAAQARASVMVIEQQGALLGKRIEDLEVRAPFAGVVTVCHADPGAWIAAGGPVVDLVDVSSLEGWFDVPQELFEQSAALARSSGTGGDRAVLEAIEVRSTVGESVRATALRVIPEIDERSRTFHAVIEVPNGDGAARSMLAPGLALVAYIPQGAPTAWSMVPKDAVVYQGSSTLVYAVRGGVAMPVSVRVAFPLGDAVAVDTASLAPGTAVVVEGNERLMPMSPVTPIADPSNPDATSGGAAQ